MTPVVRPHRVARSGNPLRWLASLALAAGVCACVLSAHADDEIRAVTALTINGLPAGETLVFQLEGRNWIPEEALTGQGLRTTGGLRRTLDGRPFIALESLAPDVTFVFDELDVVLRIQAVGSRFGVNDLRLSSLRPRELERATNASGFLNYSTTFGDGGASVATEAGMTVGGWFLHGSLTRTGPGDLLRGPFSVTRDDERRLRRWEIGDTTLGGGPFGGVIPIAGLSITRQFSIDPYFVQYTPLQLTGSAATPSVADVIVNGQLVRRVPIAPGTFTIHDLPVAVGAGQAEVIVRDAFGREQRIGSTFYTPASVLRPGLHEYHYGVGLRRDDATRMWGYEELVATGEHRVGVRDGLTMGGRVEASRRLTGVAPSVAMRLPFGEMEALGAVSRADRRIGGAGLIAWSYRGRLFNGSLSWRGASRAYATLGQFARPLALLPNGSAVTVGGGTTAGVDATDVLDATTTIGGVRVPGVRSDVQASIGWAASRRVSLSAQYARLRRWALADAALDPPIEMPSEMPDYWRRSGREERLLVGASWQISTRIGVTASVGRSRDGVGRARGEAFVGLNVFLRERLSGSVGFNRGVTEGATVALQRSAPIGPGYGYRLQWQSDPGNAGADVQAQSRVGRVELRSARLDDRSMVSASAMGALAIVGGRVHATRPIDDAFALVRVGEVAGVRAFASNQYVGTTDRHGDVLVPNLVSYYGNRLSIATEDVPLTHDIGAAERIVAPSLRGGALVRFAAPTRWPVIGRFLIAEGDGLVPAYGEAQAMALRDAEVSPLGRLGEFYFERLAAGPHRINLRFADRWFECVLVVPDRIAADGRPVDLGTVTCREPLARTRRAEVVR